MLNAQCSMLDAYIYICVLFMCTWVCRNEDEGGNEDDGGMEVVIRSVGIKTTPFLFPQPIGFHIFDQ